MVPGSHLYRDRNREPASGEGERELPTFGSADDDAGGFEALECVGDGLSASADGGAKLLEAVGTVVERGEDALCELGARERRWGVSLADIKAQGTRGEGERERGR